MHALSVSLLAFLLLTLSGCGEKEKNHWELSDEVVAADAKVAEKKFDPSEWEPVPEAMAEKFANTKKKAEAGDADAQFNLGGMYNTGEGVPNDSSKAVELSRFGDPLLGNAAKAVEWWQKAAAQGHAYAQYNLGVMYSNGEGVPRDASKAVEWFQKAAAQGHAEAQNLLAGIYYAGEGVPKNVAKAIELFVKAAAQDNTHAQDQLCYLYDGAEGMKRDIAKALEWCQKAAMQGSAYSQTKLARFYLNGDGVPKDASKAVEWLQKAAAQGHADAQVGLGLTYASGKNISKNIVVAYAWLNLAAAQGDTDAKRNRDIAESEMSPAQRAEGQRLASNWKKGDILLASSGASSGFTSPGGKLSKQGTGTAFAVSSEGHALTNHHVIKGCAEVKVAGREGIAKVITSDSVNDLALLQLPGKTSDIASLNPDLGKLRQGEDIIVFGYPLNFVLSSGGNLTPGTISALTGLGNNTNQIQITAAIQPGSSGSPVMDKKANVVGVVAMKLDDVKMARATGSVGQSVNFAVNGQTVKSFLDANKVPYKTGGGIFSREKSNADIAEEASKWTVLVECWK